MECQNVQPVPGRAPAGAHGPSPERVSRPEGAGPLSYVGQVWAYLRANRLAISVFETHDEIVTRWRNAWNLCARGSEATGSIMRRGHARAVKG